MVRGIIVDIKSPNIMFAWSLGHDDILGRMLKENRMSPRTELFNQSIILSKLPNEWKVARVCPVPKSHGHGQLSPHFLCSQCKLLEKHI